MVSSVVGSVAFLAVRHYFSLTMQLLVVGAFFLLRARRRNEIRRSELNLPQLDPQTASPKSTGNEIYVLILVDRFVTPKILSISEDVELSTVYKGEPMMGTTSQGLKICYAEYGVSSTQNSKYRGTMEVKSTHSVCESKANENSDGIFICFGFTNAV